MCIIYNPLGVLGQTASNHVKGHLSSAIITSDGSDLMFVGESDQCEQKMPDWILERKKKNNNPESKCDLCNKLKFVLCLS